MYRFLVALVRITGVLGFTLFNDGNRIFSDHLDVRVVRRSRRDAYSVKMADVYDIRLTTNGEQIDARLTRNDIDEDLMANTKDWATYTSEDIDGVFLLHRDQNNHTALTIEGYMLHKGSPYLIQPHAVSKSHVMYRIGDDLRRYRDPQTLRKTQRRHRRDDSLLSRDLSVTVDVYYDSVAREYLRSVWGDGTEDFLNKHYAMVILYIDHMLKSLEKWGTKIACRGGGRKYFQFTDAQQRSIEGDRSSDGVRKTACAVVALKRFAQRVRPWQSTDHSMLLSGYDLMERGSTAIVGLGQEKSICTVKSASIVELTLNLRGLIVTAHELMHSLGATHDEQKGVPDAQPCKAAERYIMSPFTKSVYVGEHKQNRWCFSQCSHTMMLKHLQDMNSKTSEFCLLKTPTGHHPTGLPRYVLLPSEQCKLVVGAASEYTPLSGCYFGVCIAHPQADALSIDNAARGFYNVILSAAGCIVQDWATYMSEDIDGVFILHRGQNRITITIRMILIPGNMTPTDRGWFVKGETPRPNEVWRLQSLCILTKQHETMSMFSLGSDHDGERGVRDARFCQANENYIMAPKQLSPYIGRNKENRWFFSSCTHKMLVKNLKRIHNTTSKTCLLPGRWPADKPTALPRYDMTPDQQCKMVMGSIASYSPEFIPDIKVCVDGLRCLIPVEGKKMVVLVLPYPGTPCGGGKQTMNSDKSTDRSYSVKMYGLLSSNVAVFPRLSR